MKLPVRELDAIECLLKTAERTQGGRQVMGSTWQGLLDDFIRVRDAQYRSDPDEEPLAWSRSNIRCKQFSKNCATNS